MSLFFLPIFYYNWFNDILSLFYDYLNNFFFYFFFSLAIEKLRSMDDAFRKQLESKERAFQEKITQLQEETQQQVEEANQRVIMNTHRAILFP